MRRLLPALILPICLLASGCGSPNAASSGQTPESATVSTSSAPPVSSATPTPASTPAALMPTVEPSAAPLPEPIPLPAPSRGPHEVNPADYNSYAIDTVNGGIPLPGVAFRTEDGRTICGIFTWGHLYTEAGTATCTVDTYKQIYPQPYPDTGPFVMSVMVSPSTGPSGLYPDWFAQPAREIPVLADGMSMVYEGTTCTSSGTDVTCTVGRTGQGFTLAPTGYSYF